MNRKNLGEKLLQWHASMSDPIYAVGSFYVSDTVYPNAEIVRACLSGLRKDIRQKRAMLRGEKVRVYNKFHAKWVEDLRAFAGYSDKDLRKDIRDLKVLAKAVKAFLAADYPSPVALAHGA